MNCSAGSPLVFVLATQNQRKGNYKKCTSSIDEPQDADFDYSKYPVRAMTNPAILNPPSHISEIWVALTRLYGSTSKYVTFTAFHLYTCGCANKQSDFYQQ